MLMTDETLLGELNIPQLFALKEFLGKEGGLDNRLFALYVAEEIARRAAAKSCLQVFKKYVRGVALHADDEKALDTSRDDRGGFGVPQPALSEYLRQVQPLALWQAVTKRYPTKGDQYPVAVSQAAMQVMRRGDTETHQVTEAHEINREGIPVHDLVATPKVSTALLDGDPAYPEQTLFPEFLDAAMAQESKEILIGNGVGQCEGMLTCSSITEVKTGNASTLTADGIIGLETAVPEPYRSRGKWIMARSTLDVVRKLKDSSGAYLFAQVGETETLRGRPVIVDDNAPAVASGAVPILFGDLAYYYLAIRQPLAILRDPYTQKGFVIFDLTRRTGGQVVRPEAFAKQKVAA